ncbi:MAG: hypothetical protein JWO77_814 [Ilumatobacteraceae bacterium]|nr:hypothetical protein [Ilumatobacteraceae bacterium]
MAFFRRTPMVKRRSDGAFDLVLDDERRDVLIELLRQLGELIEASPDHPNLARLSPPAYLEDDEADAAYQLLAGEELRTSHQAAIASVIESLGRDRLSEADLWVWIQALNSVRLVVGTRLDISDDDHRPHLRSLADAEDRSLWAVYEFTTGLQHDIVGALSS